jgi:hypothetical protein
MATLTTDFIRRGIHPTLTASIEHDPTHKDTWEYYYDQGKHRLYPKSYRTYTRQTPRHKWVVVASYGNSDRREDTLKVLPSPPRFVSEAALERFTRELTVE